MGKVRSLDERKKELNKKLEAITIRERIEADRKKLRELKKK
jgi:hypothetical protein